MCDFGLFLVKSYNVVRCFIANTILSRHANLDIKNFTTVAREFKSDLCRNIEGLEDFVGTAVKEEWTFVYFLGRRMHFATNTI